jgi:hypothetical protein
MPRTQSPTPGPIGRRRFLATAAAWGVPPLLLGCRQAPADAAQHGPAALRAADFRQGALNDRQVLERAFQAWTARGGGTLHLEPGRVYDLGPQRDRSNVFVVFGLQDAVLAGHGATLKIHSDVRGVFNLLYLAHYRNLRIENLSCLDTGYRNLGQEGGKFIVLDAAERDSVDITFDNLAGEGLISFIHVQGLPGGPRVRGIRIMPNCRATRVFYALNCLDNGDDISGGFSTFNCARSYFPYGVTGHDLTVRIHHQGERFGPIAESAVLIKTYGRPTSGIRLDVGFAGVLASNGACVTLEHQPERPGPPSIIEDVDLRITIAPGTPDPLNIPRLILRSYRYDRSEEIGRTANFFRRISVGGNLRPGGGPAIYSRVGPAEAAELTIARGTVGAEPRNISAPGFRIRRAG